MKLKEGKKEVIKNISFTSSPLLPEVYVRPVRDIQVQLDEGIVEGH
jgi:hypothetical protein